MTYAQLLAKLQNLTPAQLKQHCLVVDPWDSECMNLSDLEIVSKPEPDDAIPKGRVILKTNTFVQPVV